MHGNKMIGLGTKQERATLTFKRNKKPFLVATSRGFIVRPDRITSDNAAITIYSDSDSLTHPSLQLKYVNKDRMLTLTRNREAGLTSPFFNSFHQMDIYVDAIYWKVDDPIMELKMTTGAGESKMTMESTRLFTDERFRKPKATVPCTVARLTRNPTNAHGMNERVPAEGVYQGLEFMYRLVKAVSRPGIS